MTVLTLIPSYLLFVACRKLFSWVGVIMYLPADDADARRRVTDAFLAYRDLCKTHLWDRCVWFRFC